MPTELLERDPIDLLAFIPPGSPGGDEEETPGSEPADEPEEEEEKGS